MRSRTISAILVESMMRNAPVKLFKIWNSDSGGDIVLNISYLELWQGPLFNGAEPFVQIWKIAS